MTSKQINKPRKNKPRKISRLVSKVVKQLKSAKKRNLQKDLRAKARRMTKPW